MRTIRPRLNFLPAPAGHHNPRGTRDVSSQHTLGLGLAALGRPGYINLGHTDDLPDRDPDAMHAHCGAVLDAAWAAGVRYFDAARSYGRSEEFLAGWLRDRAIAPEQVVIGSKWGYTYTADWRVTADKHEVKDHSLTAFTRQLAESRQLLGDQLDLYQVHSATLDSGVLNDALLHDELRRLRDTGIRIGLTLSGPRQADTLRQALALRIFQSVQATWNLLEPSCGPALAEAAAAGLSVIVKEALANGRLAHAAPAWLRERAEQANTSTATLALAAALAQPWANVILSGAATVAQMQQNCTALDVRFPGDWPTEGAEPPEQYWATRAGLAWN